jgi:hypothetical protein
MTKRALVVGINDYPGTGSDLFGCINDMNDWADVLDRQGFEVSYLADQDATREGILDQLRLQLDRAKSGDLFLFQYSGHGTWVPGKPDEPRDEAICPYDIASVGPIIDDELFALFSRRGAGRRAVMIADSCYSGDIQRLAGPLADGPRAARFLPPEAWMRAEETLKARATYAVQGVSRSLRSGALVLAGCGEKQVCYDATFAGRPNGAFTYVALAALKELADLAPDRPINYRAWMRVIRKYLPSVDFDQKPQLDGLSYQKDWPILDDGAEG